MFKGERDKYVNNEEQIELLSEQFGTNETYRRYLCLFWITRKKFKFSPEWAEILWIWIEVPVSYYLLDCSHFFLLFLYTSSRVHSISGKKGTRCETHGLFT